MAAVAEEPYLVFDTRENTVAIRNKSIKSNFQSRVVPVPAPKMVDKIQELACPINNNEINQNDYHTGAGSVRESPRVVTKNETPAEIIEITSNK